MPKKVTEETQPEETINELSVVEKQLSEIEFLESLIQIQDVGGWPKNLHPVIYQRIKDLQNNG